MNAQALESDYSPEIRCAVTASSRLAVIVTPAGKVLLRGAGPVGYRYDVLASQNLSNWSVLTNLAMDALSSFQFTDSTAPRGANSVRYYRLRQTSP